MHLFSKLKFHFHKWRPVKVFLTLQTSGGYYSRILDQHIKEYSNYRASLTGFICQKCGARKIEKTHKAQSPGAQQEAYDWLNDANVASGKKEGDSDE